MLLFYHLIINTFNFFFITIIVCFLLMTLNIILSLLMIEMDQNALSSVFFINKQPRLLVLHLYELHQLNIFLYNNINYVILFQAPSINCFVIYRILKCCL